MIAQEIQDIQDQIRILQDKLNGIIQRNTTKADVMPEHDLDIALTMYADHLRADYVKWGGKPEAKYDVTFERGRKFIKVVQSSYGSRAVHGFICIQPHDQWLFGDILKAASWSAPAKNFTRGNVLDTNSYSHHKWTGA